MRTALALTLLLLVPSLVAADEKGTVWKNPGLKVSIEMPPGFTEDKSSELLKEGETQLLVVFAGEKVKDFANNVNVLAQDTKLTLAEYTEATTSEIKQAGWKVNSTKNVKAGGKDAVIFDYEAKDEDRELRFLAIAVSLGGDKILLVTCTALKSEWPKVEKAFAKCVESVAFEK